MRTRAAVLTGVGEKWLIDDVELADPGPFDVLVEMKAAGPCHEEVRLQRGLPSQFPLVGGHEGAGVVVATGSGVRGLAVGDHVATSFIPACGSCPPCASGRQYLCDAGRGLLQKDGSPRVSWRGQQANAYAGLGTFAEHALVSEESLVKVEEQVPSGAAEAGEGPRVRRHLRGRLDRRGPPGRPALHPRRDQPRLRGSARGPRPARGDQILTGVPPEPRSVHPKVWDFFRNEPRS
jgi:hypothetical protein